MQKEPHPWLLSLKGFCPWTLPAKLGIENVEGKREALASPRQKSTLILGGWD